MTSLFANLPATPSEDPQELAIQLFESAILPPDSSKSVPETLDWLGKQLGEIHSATSDSGLLRVIAKVHSILDDDNGLELVARWSIKHDASRSRTEIESLWASLKPVPKTPASPDTLTDSPQLTSSSNEAQPQPSSVAQSVRNALDKYTVNGQLSEIERLAVEQKAILGKLALMGQATMFYAAPNTGKTLISFALTIEAIKAGLINPECVYYINNDDTTIGLAEKLRIAEEYGFKMLAEAYQEFDARDLLQIFTKMIDRDEARNVVVILDTATKVVNVLDATKTRAFTQVIRKFVLKGGTVIALAHANKNPGADGKAVYRGTTDIINDFDCVYMLSQLQADSGEKIVVFDNKKRRGNVVQSAAYSYSTESGISYHELLVSVKEVDATKLDEFQQADTLRSDAEMVSIVQSCITRGVNTKMLLGDEAAKIAGVSKRTAIKIIEKYTGENPAVHRWLFTVRDRGAKVYALLDDTLPPAPDPSTAA